MSFAAKKAMASVKMKQDKMTTEKAGRKRGLWGSIGSGLGGLVGLGLTAGMGPIGAGIYTGLASGAGGFLGSRLLTDAKHKNVLRGEHKGTTFYKEEARELGRKVDEDIIATAGKTGLSAGMAQIPGMKGAENVDDGSKGSEELTKIWEWIKKQTEKKE